MYYGICASCLFVCGGDEVIPEACSQCGQQVANPVQLFRVLGDLLASKKKGHPIPPPVIAKVKTALVQLQAVFDSVLNGAAQAE